MLPCPGEDLGLEGGELFLGEFRQHAGTLVSLLHVQAGPLHHSLVHPRQEYCPFRGSPRSSQLGFPQFGDQVLAELSLDFQLVTHVDQWPRQRGQGPVEVGRVGPGDQLVDGVERDGDDCDADQAIDQEWPLGDMACEGQVGLDGLDRVRELPFGDLDACFDGHDQAQVPHRLKVGQTDIDDIEPLLGHGIIPVARLAVRPNSICWNCPLHSSTNLRASAVGN